MEREQVAELVAEAPEALVVKWAERILAGAGSFTMVDAPKVGLVLLQARDTVDGQRFYVGEALVAEARVELDGHPGYGMVMGRAMAKALAAAVLDAAVAVRHPLVPELEEALAQVEQDLKRTRRRWWQTVARTRVQFEEVGA